MGEQVIYSVFGGKVEETGVILHGKTSPLRHDSKGLFEGLVQDLPVTRYHSLAGTHPTLPECLEVSSWVASGREGESNIIMGVRHKELLVEGVQFHPESILTAEGRSMFRNFLNMQGGTWNENRHFRAERTADAHVNPSGKNTDIPAVDGISDAALNGKKNVSILDEIFAHRKIAVESQKQIPSQRPSDLQASYNLSLAPPQISFPERLRRSPFSLSLMAEIKRASPSKGDIALNISAAEQARKYAVAGASVISVLTEPKWFKGGVEDLRAVRLSLDGMPNRPAVLRKEFVFDEYQILEGRLAGCDSVLLIVKMLSEETLRRLYLFSKSLRMEPLVEVNTPGEMEIAIRLGAQVIGVNNRDLTTFKVDLETTSRLMDNVPKETIVCALSGISGANDVKAYRSQGVGAVLVGEALMRADRPDEFADRLLGSSQSVEHVHERQNILVKICGTRTPEAAKAAAEAGADMVGIILVQGRKRCVSTEAALAIAEAVRTSSKPSPERSSILALEDTHKSMQYFEYSTKLLSREDRSLLVGVFQNQPLSYILGQVQLLGLDVVQLHGSEPIEWARLIPVPVIRRFRLNDEGIGHRGYHALSLLDSASGGTGQRLDANEIKSVLERDGGLRVVLAGGLDPTNVQSVLTDLSGRRSQIVAVDVSSGVEENGSQSLERIRAFVNAAKKAWDK